jgi:hypothetical protein
MTPGHVTSDHMASGQWHPLVECHVFFNYIIYISIGQNDTANQPMTSGLWCVYTLVTVIWPFAQWHPTTWHPPMTSISGVPFLQSIIYIYIHWLKRHECSSSDARQRVPGFFYYIIYIFFGQHGTIARPMTSGQWLLAMWHSITMTPTSGKPCFFNYMIYIFIGQNDTAIEPITSGPVTAGHVTSTIGVPFLQSIIYIYIHWLKRHESSSSDACQRAAVFF